MTTHDQLIIHQQTTLAVPRKQRGAVSLQYERRACCPTRQAGHEQAGRATSHGRLSGYDFFEDLVEAGIVENRREVPRDLAEETWRCIGNDVLDYTVEFHRGFVPPERPIWAEREFGPPDRKKRHAGTRWRE